MRYELMTYSDVMRQWERRSVRNKHYQFEKGVMPQDKSWQVVVLVAPLAIGLCVMFVRWWLCV